MIALDRAGEIREAVVCSTVFAILLEVFPVTVEALAWRCKACSEEEIADALDALRLARLVRVEWTRGAPATWSPVKVGP